MKTRTDPFFLMAGLYLTVGLLAVVGVVAVDLGVLEPFARLRWVTIHLVTIGAMTQALFGALPALVGSAVDREEAVGGDAPTRWAQWLALNVGYVLVLLGMVTGATVVAVAGATLVLGALALLIVEVRRLTRRASRTLGRAYRVAPWFLVVGILAAFGMLFGLHGPGGYFGSLEAHVHANVWGFLGLVVAATLLQFAPAFAGTDRRRPRRRRVAVAGLTLGATGLVAGPWLAVHALTIAGLLTYVVGTAALLSVLVGAVRDGERTASTRVAHVVGAYGWLLVPVPFAPVVLLAPGVLPAAAIERAAIHGLVFGWMLQLAMAMLPAVVAAFDGRDGDLADRVASTDYAPSWVGVAAANLGMLALWLAALPPFEAVAGTLSTVGFALVAVAWASLVVALWSRLAGGGRGRSGESVDRGAVPGN
ncbi:hypothetical protein [Halomicrococcus gelatinilyticus]|uniref:hypothetical protein n=1 Tax=Halomicrococcus gelatinilyticus TaxID=1702103 RepID=UPI002E152B77